MNKKDRNYLKQGYWEEDLGSFNAKGHYIDGKKNGVWKKYSKDSNKLLEVINFSIGNTSTSSVNYWRDREKKLFDIDYSMYPFRTVHTEEIYNSKV